MKTLVAGLIFLSLTGCSNFFHKETCYPQKDNTQFCKHVIEFETSVPCEFSCKKK